VLWLAQNQHDDGSWRSKTYGSMRDGVTNTAIALYALACVPNEIREKARLRVDRAEAFISAEHERLVEFPTYSKALALAAACRLHPKADSDRVVSMRQSIIASQQSAARGWSSEDRDFGGWNHTDFRPHGAAPPGDTNLSVTCFALEALWLSGGVDESTQRDALQYVRRCQNFGDDFSDGGFFFTAAIDDPRNKAGLFTLAGGRAAARSYGTPTADGIAALALCGVGGDDPAMRAAVNWLAQHNEADEVPGFDETSPVPGFRTAMTYYYAAALSRLVRYAPAAISDARRQALVRSLVASQRTGGDWQNTSGLMREDDPLLATALAVTALGNLLDALGVK
jgi:hypothetical protein